MTLTENQAWLGGFKGKDNQWRWTDGSTWDYTNWARGQPNNMGGNQNKMQLNFGGKGNWDDVQGGFYNSGLPFICQKNLLTIPRQQRLVMEIL